MTQLTGTLATLRIYRGTWGRGMVEMTSGGTIAVVGTRLAKLKKGGSYQFDGEITQHPKYGEQFDVAAVTLANTSTAPVANSTKARRKKAALAPDADGAPARRPRSASTGGKRKRRGGKRVLTYVPDDLTEYDPHKARRQRMENAAYEWAQQLAGDLGQAEREQSIYTHLCQTLVWAEFGEVVREVAAATATLAQKRIRAARSALPPARCYTDGEIVVHYESAFHIGLDLAAGCAGQGVQALARLIYLALKDNEARGRPAHDDDGSKAAALAAAETLM